MLEEQLLGEEVLNATGACNSILKEGQATYKTVAKEVKVRQCSPIKFRNKFRQALSELSVQTKKQF